jgi:hypothetical protein
MLAEILASATLALCSPYNIPGSGVESPVGVGSWTIGGSCERWVRPGHSTLPISGAFSEVRSWVYQEDVGPDKLDGGYLREALIPRGTRWGCVDLWSRFGARVKVNRCRARTHIYFWRTKPTAPKRVLALVVERSLA